MIWMVKALVWSKTSMFVQWSRCPITSGSAVTLWSCLGLFWTYLVVSSACYRLEPFFLTCFVFRTPWNDLPFFTSLRYLLFLSGSSELLDLFLPSVFIRIFWAFGFGLSSHYIYTRVLHCLACNTLDLQSNSLGLIPDSGLTILGIIRTVHVDHANVNICVMSTIHGPKCVCVCITILWALGLTC